MLTGNYSVPANQLKSTRLWCIFYKHCASLQTFQPWLLSQASLTQNTLEAIHGMAISARVKIQLVTHYICGLLNHSHCLDQSLQCTDEGEITALIYIQFNLIHVNKTVKVVSKQHPFFYFFQQNKWQQMILRTPHSIFYNYYWPKHFRAEVTK